MNDHIVLEIRRISRFLSAALAMIPMVLDAADADASADASEESIAVDRQTTDSPITSSSMPSKSSPSSNWSMTPSKKSSDCSTSSELLNEKNFKKIYPNKLQ